MSDLGRKGFWAALLLAGSAAMAADPVVLNLWPGKPPGETKELPPEADTTKPDGNLVAGKRVIRLGNVSTPQIAVYKPAPEKDTGAAVVICPGGGHHILAYDLEGTEVAEWLNGIGVTGVVLKYRVPFRDPEKRWRAAVQDAHRAIRLVRANAGEWKIRPDRIGVLGFSAGGETAGRAALHHAAPEYEPVDEADKLSARPDFAVLVYTGGFFDSKAGAIREDVKADETTPPMFFAHAFDDRVDVRNSLVLAAELKRAGGSADVHLYAHGGHGFGLRKTQDPCTTWPARCEEWMRRMGWLAP